MFIANGAVYTKGKETFAQRFKMQLELNRAWKLEIEWGQSVTRSNEQEETAFIVHLYVPCGLSLQNDVIEEFGMEAQGIVGLGCQEILDKKERELVRKIQQVPKEA